MEPVASQPERFFGPALSSRQPGSGAQGHPMPRREPALSRRPSVHRARTVAGAGTKMVPRAVQVTPIHGEFG